MPAKTSRDLSLCLLLCVAVLHTDAMQNAVPDLPTLTAQYKPAEHGRQLSLTCVANNSTNNPLIWCYLYKDGVRVSQQNGSLGSVIYTEPAMRRSSGVYACTFTNWNGESLRSKPLNISVNPYTPGIPVTGGGSDIKGNNIFYNSFSFLPANDTPALYYTLYINGRKYSEGQSETFYLYHDVSGMFQVEAHTYDATSSRSSPVQVTYYDAPAIVPVPNAPPVLNQNYTLVCTHGVPGGKTRWSNYKGHVLLMNSSTIQLKVTEDPIWYSFSCLLEYNKSRIEGYYYFDSAKPRKPQIVQLSVKVFPYSTNESAVALVCSINDIGSISWYRNGVKVTGQSRMSGHAQITRLPDTGVNYSCSVTNTVGESDQSDTVYVPGQHELVVSASDPVACLGRPVNLTCKLKSLQPNAIYSWEFYRDNGTGKADVFERSTLTFASVTAQDQGLYLCRVNITNQIYYAEKHYTIAFKGPETPKLSAGVYFDEFGSLQFSVFCESTTVLVDINRSFRFYKNGILIRQQEFITNLYLGDGKLSFSRALLTESTSYEGNYSCTSVNLFGESKPAFVYINKIADLTQPSIQCNDSNPAIGSSIKLTCIAPNYITDDQITWRKDNSPLIVRGRSLILGYLGNEDDGLYQCSYSHNFELVGNLERTSQRFLLTLIKPLQPQILFDASKGYFDFPYPIHMPVFYQFGLGQPVPLRCNPVIVVSSSYASTAGLNYTYRFYKDGTRISPVNLGGGSFYYDGLPIGEYNFTCTVSNGRLESDMSYPLLVVVTPQVTILPSSQSPALGTSLILTCNTSAASNGRDITWVKNGFPLTETSRQLRLNNIAYYDEGRYNCRQNVGKWEMAVSGVFVLAIGSRPVKPIFFANEEKVVEFGSYLYLYCISVSLSSSRAEFYKNNQLINVSLDGVVDDVGHIAFNHKIVSVNESVRGNYSCLVVNDKGRSESSDFKEFIVVTSAVEQYDRICNFSCASCTKANTKACHANNSTCECYRGWNGITCNSDIDECQEATSQCNDPNSQCVNKPGYYTCLCTRGFYAPNPNSLTCEECPTGFYGVSCASNCSCKGINSICDKVTGNCTCKSGWEGPNCANDIDECKNGNSICDSVFSKRVCVNTIGGFNCACPTGYMLSSSNVCEAVFSITFEIRFPLFNPLDSILDANSIDNQKTIQEIQIAILRQLKKILKGFLNFLVKNLRRGSLIASVDLLMFVEQSENNTVGEMTKGLTSMNWTDVTINGTKQTGILILYNGNSISVDSSQCVLRNIFQPCPSNSHCEVNKDGVPFCQHDSVLNKLDLYIGIGVGLGVALLIAIAVIITVCVIKCNKKKGVAK